MAVVRAVCPHCKRVVSAAGVPPPGAALRCEHCGASFPLQLVPTNSQAAPPTTGNASISHRSRYSLLLMAAAFLVTAAAVGVLFVNRGKPSVATEAKKDPTAADKNNDTDRAHATVKTDVASTPKKEPNPSPSVTSDATAAAARDVPNSKRTVETNPRPSPETVVAPPANWSAATAVLRVHPNEGDKQPKTVAMATAIGSRRFVTRALPILATGVKDPVKDMTRLVLVGSFGERRVVRVIYHPSLPMAKLAEGGLAPEDYLSVMLHDAALLVVEEPTPSLEPSILDDADAPPTGSASVATYLEDGAAISFELKPATVDAPRRPSIPLPEIRCDAVPAMEGAGVFVKGRLAGILLVNLDATSRPAAPHNVLTAARLRELLARP
jgi:hypothetical protein